MLNMAVNNSIDNLEEELPAMKANPSSMGLFKLASTRDLRQLSKRTSSSKLHQTERSITRYSASDDVLTKKPERTFWTNSRYSGEWSAMGMSGTGVYTMPHCVVYEGDMADSMFHGKGVLKYPDGSQIEGEWCQGKMISSRYVFPDGLVFTPEDWEYCSENDRRFWKCVQEGLKPAGRTLKTNRQPTREIPPKCYDNEEGFYDPKTRCLLDPEDDSLKTVLRVPTDKEVAWIEKHCRRSWTENTGFQPQLYRDWQDLKRDLALMQERELRTEGYSSSSSTCSSTASPDGSVIYRSGLPRRSDPERHSTTATPSVKTSVSDGGSHQHTHRSSRTKEHHHKKAMEERRSIFKKDSKQNRPPGKTRFSHDHPDSSESNGSMEESDSTSSNSSSCSSEEINAAL